MALKITFGESDMMRIVASSNPNPGFLDVATLFTGDYAALRVTGLQADASVSFLSFGTTYAQPPLVFGGLDVGGSQRSIYANLDWRWTNLGGSVFGFRLQTYSLAYYYIVTTTGIYQYFYNYGGTAKYWVLEP